MNANKLLTIGILCLSIVSGITYAANERIVRFAIPNNQYCDDHHGSEVSISISNISDVEQTIRLDLFKIDGTLFNSAGTSNNGIGSELDSGTNFTLSAHATTTFHMPFGDSGCSNRVYHGKITIKGNNGLLLASGFVSGRQAQNFRSGATINIMNGQPF